VIGDASCTPSGFLRLSNRNRDEFECRVCNFPLRANWNFVVGDTLPVQPTPSKCPLSAPVPPNQSPKACPFCVTIPETGEQALFQSVERVPPDQIESTRSGRALSPSPFKERGWGWGEDEVSSNRPGAEDVAHPHPFIPSPKGEGKLHSLNAPDCW
jgi:hypothetical protein